MHTTLSGRLWPVAADANLLRNILLIVGGTCLVAAAAHISIPLKPVPMTLQTLAVLLIGAAYGSRMGATTLALYATAGAAGLPVFSPTPDGYPGILGPSGGYIIGFIVAAAVVGWFAERGWDRTAPKLLLPMLLGAAVIYVPGLLWLNTFIHSVPDTIAAGFTPFVWGDVIKAVVATLGIPAAWSFLGREE